MERALVEDVFIPFETANKARTFQLKFGGFRRALQRDADSYPMLAIGSYGVQISRQGTVVVVGPKKCEQEVLAVLGGTVQPLSSNPEDNQ